MHPTSYKNVDTLLDVLVTQILSVLGGNLVGVYLYGSLVSGDFDHDLSDIDLLAVTSRTVSKRELEALKKMHEILARQYPKWNDRIEVQYVSCFALRTFKTQTSNIVTISPGEPIHFIKAGKDWLFNWYEVQEKGMVLFGPHHASIIPSISKREYMSAVKDSALYWRERIEKYTHQSSRGSCSYSVLTMCRMLYGYRYGKQASKTRAAVWAAKEYPQWTPLVADAVSWRKTQWEKEQKSIGAALSDIRNFVYFTIEQVVKE